jgi:hypothetical protein
MKIFVVPSVNRFPFNYLYEGDADDASALSIIRGEDLIV